MRAPIDTLEAHVLARAYDAAWRALYLCEPVGQHAIESLGLAIDFGPTYYKIKKKRDVV